MGPKGQMTKWVARIDESLFWMCELFWGMELQLEKRIRFGEGSGNSVGHFLWVVKGFQKLESIFANIKNTGNFTNIAPLF